MFKRLLMVALLSGTALAPANVRAAEIEAKSLINIKKKDFINDLKNFEPSALTDQKARDEENKNREAWVEEQVYDILMLCDRNDPPEKYKQAVKEVRDQYEKSAQLYKLETTQVGDVSLPDIGACRPLKQTANDQACLLYSILGAALQLPDFRAILNNSLVRQDAAYAYFQFPHPQVSDEESPVLSPHKNNTYKVKKEIHTGGLLPSVHPWVNLYSKAVFEHAKVAAISSSEDCYEVTGFIKDRKNLGAEPSKFLNFLFGVRELMIPGDYNKGSYISIEGEKEPTHLGRIRLLLKKDGTIEQQICEINKPCRVVRTFSGSNTILLTPGKTHAITTYFDLATKLWKRFDNQQDLVQCGESDQSKVSAYIQDSPYIKIISLARNDVKKRKGSLVMDLGQKVN